MRTRHLVAASVVSIAVMAAAILAASQVLVRQFDSIEAGQSAEKATQGLRALEADLNQLAVSNRDYAEWDDAASFVTSRDPEFLRANFSVDSLRGMHVDLIAILGQDGSPLYTAHLNDAEDAMTDGLPNGLEASLAPLQKTAAMLRTKPSSQRLLVFGDRLLAFSMIEIARSDHTGATGAALFFGRYILQDELQRIRETSQLPVSLTRLDASGSPLADPGAPLSAETLRAATRAQSMVIDEHSVVGYEVVRDWNGAPLAVATVASPRDIGYLGRRTTTWLMSAIGLLILLSAGMLGVMFARLRKSWDEQVAMKNSHEHILSSLDEVIALVDPATLQIKDANDAFLRTLDFEREDLPDLTLPNVFVDLRDVKFSPETSAAGLLRECRLRASDGHLIDAEVNLTAFDDNGKSLMCIVGRDVSRRRKAEADLKENQLRLAHLTEHDALTGLPNRQYLQARLPKLLYRMATEERALALMYIDIDHFKNTNDSRGHGAGDELLKVIGKRLRDATAAEDAVLRVGGDEFVVISPLADAQTTKVAAQKLLTLLREPIQIGDVQTSVTASIGIALYPQDGLDGETLLKHADIALYQAKEKGRNAFQAFSSDMNLQLSEHVLLEQALRRAIDTDEIYVEYQPVVDLNAGLLVSFESLARWRHPEMGLIPPGRFIPVAEKCGLIAPLGQQVVRTVIAQLSEWQHKGLTLTPVAINVAPLQFEQTDFATFVHETAESYNIDPKLVAFEVTESTLLRDSSKHVVEIDTLRHAGSRVYIDDFGTGFSNLSYLKTLPVDAVKIDQSFVKSVESDADDAAIISSVVSVARQLALDTIAEGVETKAQAEKLRELGVRYGQGYYFSRPIHAEQCRALLEQLGAARKLTETVKARAWQRVAN